MREDGTPAKAGGERLSTVSRAISVLDELAASDRTLVGVSELAARLDLSKTVVHRIVTSLVDGALLDQDETTRHYRLGPGVLRLSQKYLRDLDVLDLARSSMAGLSADTNETVTLSIRSGTGRSYVAQVTPDREVIMTVEIGREFPLHAASSGKAFLAHLRAGEIEDYLAGPLVSLTPNTVTKPEKLRDELERVRRRGYAQSVGERQPGAASVAAPILDASGRPVAVISVCGPSERFAGDLREPSRALLDITNRLSARMGHRVDSPG